MRIAIDATVLQTGRMTGVERYTTHMLADLPAARKDWEWHALSCAADLTFAGETHRVHDWPRVARDQYAMSRLLRRLNPDVACFPGLSVPVFGRRSWRTVMTIYDATYWNKVSKLSKGARLYYRPCLAAALKRGVVDLVLTVSNAAGEDIRAADVVRAPVVGVPLGVDNAFVADVPTSGNDALSEEPFILTVGTVEPRKNLATLMKAYSALAAANDDAPRLVIVGRQGWGRKPEVAAHVRERVTYLHNVSDGELRNYYQRCVLFVFPTMYEGYGLPLVEAMANGAVCVASDLAVLREVAGDGAEFVEPLDATAWTDTLASLLRDVPRRRRLSAAARQRAASTTWRGWAEKTVRTLEELCAK